MSQSTPSQTSSTTPPTTLKTAATTTTTKKKLRLRAMVNQVYKLFVSSTNAQQANEKAKKGLVLPSISVTSPDGETTAVE
ncbi:unnamed protein product [Rotaria socialis]|uniref:Uncharacterized protein n=2 Tax=Rotaria socialis TaxID=392032 RepID=A0A820EFN1_9BILA|nr:unnamed protein product [Rotaria socialis]CAF3355170.1 unnamed protein product [Rotaria socialis]CAF3391873.1 unnamed protein product [Rotaria socialis]CAF3501148.1 unnamed protein product [Rotaria socialis]CAF3565240.1 unnamed protein product [Rotaria socialis]